MDLTAIGATRMIANKADPSAIAPSRKIANKADPSAIAPSKFQNSTKHHIIKKSFSVSGWRLKSFFVVLGVYFKRFVFCEPFAAEVTVCKEDCTE